MGDALGTLEGNVPLELDLDKLIGSHCCIQANSGAGKSGAIRKLLEITHGRIQHIVIDTEDEFYTLREKFEYLIAGGDNGDCAATVNNAAALAMTILETGFSAIVQINSLPMDQRCEFIRIFLQALTDAPKRLWRPALIVLDEAQFYAPQKGFASSLDAIVSFMMLGRKRGFTGVLATPRPADLSKQATSPVNNWLIGRCGQPADRRSAADALGFTSNSPEARNLRSLVARQFWVFGPALTNEPVLARIEKTKTTIVKAGQATLPTPPAPAAMRQILAGLNAAAVEKTKAEDTPQIVVGDNNLSAPDPAALEEAERRGHAIGFAEGEQRGFDQGKREGYAAGWQGAVDKVLRSFGPLREWMALIEATGSAVDFTAISADTSVAVAPADFADSVPGPHQRRHPLAMIEALPPGPAVRPDGPPPRFADDGPITSTMKETLHAIAWWHRLGHRAPTRKQIGGLLGIIADGSTMRSRLAGLSKLDLIEYPTEGAVALTAAGRAAAPPVNAGRSIVETVRAALTPTQQETFDAIPGAGRSITREDLGKKLGKNGAPLEANGSTMRSRLSELSNRELIFYPKPGLVARQEWVRG